MRKRSYLVWVSANHCKMTPKLHTAPRWYDIAIHDYGDWTDEDVRKNCEAEYYLPSPYTEKFRTAANVLPALPSYSYYAFLDDDLDIDTATLNRLFVVGDSLDLDLYQPALSLDSYCSHNHLRQGALGGPVPVRPVPFVEIMCPFFSAKALQRCLPTFDLNHSGWGLDCYVWPKLVETPFVIDNLPIKHLRAPARRTRLAVNGLTPYQECEIVRKLNYDGDQPW